VKHPLLSGVIDAVIEAGNAILPFWRKALTVEHKSDASPVTQADLAAHQVLAQRLSALAPEIALLSEEDCAIPLSEREQWQRWWLIDPLDGTRGFIEGSAEFTVNVALIEQGRVVFGVVGQPTAQRLWYGGKDLGAFFREGRQAPKTLAAREPKASGFTLCASRKHSNAAQEALIAAVNQRFAPMRINVSSSLKLCLLAAGEIDLYPRLSPTSQWDIAAAQGVAEGAGAAVLNAQSGAPLNYPPKDSLLNPPLLALAENAPWREEVLALARQALGKTDGEV